MSPTLARAGAGLRDALSGQVGRLRMSICPTSKATASRWQPESLDLAVSALALQFVNDLPGVLRRSAAR